MKNSENGQTISSTSQFREVESFNLFSQGNIYTTKIVQGATSLLSEKGANVGSASLLVGTLKPPKILNIALSKSELYYSPEQIKGKGNIKRYSALSFLLGTNK